MTATASNVVLIVDDTPSNLQILFAYLESAGFKVLVAQNGKLALKIAQIKLPDLILLDILMPEIDGFEVCYQLKSQKCTQDIPIIFLTALSETLNKVKGFALGGVDYITKPIQQGEVLARIKTHLALQSMQEDLIVRNQELQQEIDTRQKIERKLQQTLKSEAAVRKIIEAIRDSLDESQILQTITEELVKLLPISGCQIELYNSDRTIATIVCEHSIMLPLCQGTSREIAEFPQLYQQLSQKLSLQFVERIPQFSPQKIQLTRLVCPIFESQDIKGIVGNLWLLKPKSELFTASEIALIEQIANQCAIAIRQARLYQTSQIQVRELEKLNHIKDDFLKTISHELRSPMSSIQLAVQTFEKIITAEYGIPQSPIFHRVLKIFRQACQRQNQLVDDLLTLCHLDAQAETIVSDWINLQTWIPAIVQPFIEQANSQQQKLFVDVSPNLPQFKSDPFTLERILRELINNACKYTPANEKIIVQVKANSEKIKLKVINSGVEIPLEERERIFDRFYRIPNNDPWQYGGTGLGLFLVKKLVELLQGSIMIESEDLTTAFSVDFAIN